MSYTQTFYHIILRTHCSIPAIVEDHERELYSYMLGFINNKGARLYRIGGLPDHVHLMLEISPEVSVYGVVKKIKGRTSHVLRETYQELRSRIPTLWTRVCLISSVGNVSLNDIETFLEEQRRR